jgi:hypothetical protein
MGTEGLRNTWMGVCEGDGDVGSTRWVVLRSESLGKICLVLE